MRHAAIIEYDGSKFNGWQDQPHAPSVQAAVERALSRVADEPIRVHASGRTDSGVHAVGQVVHFDTDKVRTPYNWLRGANSNLPEGVALSWIGPMADEFHARFSARSRRYRYILYTRRIPLGIFSSYVSCYPLDLDLRAMQTGLRALLGTHDFSAYRASECQSKKPVKTLYSIEVDRQGYWVWLDVHGDGFLHHMVRNIVGVMLKIGAGERPPEWAAEVLEGRDRRHGGITARPNGLYFLGVQYPQQFELPVIMTPPRFW